MAQEVLAPLEAVNPAVIFRKPDSVTRGREPGFFSTNSAGMRFGAREGESLDAWMARISPQVIQRGAPQQIARTVTSATDGAVTVAMDDFDGGMGAKNLFMLNGGSSVPGVQVSWYAAQSFIGYQLCGIMSQHWFIDKACTMPARDAIRNGYDVTRDDGEELDAKISNELKKLDKRFKIKQNCIEAVRKMRIFGIRIVLFEVNSKDPDYYLKPFNPDGVTAGSYKGMSQVDPYWITPELDFSAASNPASKHFYEPTYWRINGQRYHRSHLVVLMRNEVPDVLKPTYFYGGIPLPQQLYERCYAAERTSNEGPQLALTKRLTVIEGVDMSAAAGNWKGFEQRIAEFAFLRDNYGIHTLGGSEKLNQHDTTLTDVDVVIMTQWQLACAIAEVPATKMLGTMPKGFNATGEYEEASYHESLESIQEHDMEPIIQRHHLLCIRSYISPKFGVPPFETGISFEELDAETSKEFAERTNLEAERDLKWANAGAVDGLDIRRRLIKDKNSGYTGIEEAEEPDSPRPRGAVLPGAPTTAPNTEPGQQPTAAPAPPAPAAGQQPPAHDALDAAIARVLKALGDGP